MENIINNWVDSDQGSRETNLVFLSLINRINLQFGGILFLVILAIIHLIYFFKKYRQIKNIKFNLKIPLIVFFSLGVFTIFLDTLLNYLVFLNYIIALVLICLYILTTAVSISFILRDKARGLLEIPLFILGILSIFLFDIFYLIALVLLIFELYSLFVAKLGKLKIFVGLTSIILINLIFIPFVWELVWLYDNRLNTLMILLITSSFISVVNILMVESLIGKADS